MKTLNLEQMKRYSDDVVGFKTYYTVISVTNSTTPKIFDELDEASVKNLCEHVDWKVVIK